MVNFQTLLVWQRSHQLTLNIYKTTASFPTSELYGLTSQIRRSVTSIPSNIAEGCGRNSDAEFSRFFVIAMGSSAEVEYQLLLAKDLGYLSDTNYRSLNNELIEIRKMMNIFISKINQRISK